MLSTVTGTRDTGVIEAYQDLYVLQKHNWCLGILEETSH